MALTIDVLPAPPGATASRVRAAVTVPAGVEWTLTGAARRDTWLAARQVGTGSVQWLTDPRAALGTETTYELRYGSTVETGGPVTRSSKARDLILTPDGQIEAAFWHPHAEDLEYTIDNASIRVRGSSIHRYGAGGRPSGSLTAHTETDATTTLKGLLERAQQGPLVVLHNHGRCALPGCTRDLTRLLTINSASVTTHANILSEDRVWTLEYEHARDQWRFAAPVATWRDVLDHFGDNDAVAASGLTNGELAAGEWL